MKNEECIRFLQWALPQLRMRWPGFRKVRKQICKRIDRRVAALGLDNVVQYRAYLLENDEEWQQLDSLCRVTISRFCRDKGVFAVLAKEVLPSLARAASDRGDKSIRVWCAGCGSGEEPYTLAILWALELEAKFPELTLDIVATDSDTTMLRRARDACYGHGSLRELPERWRNRAFARSGDTWCLVPEYKSAVESLNQDIRREHPEGHFDLVLCRNLVFTYFDDALQVEVLRRIITRMRDGAALVIGIHEALPQSTEPLSTWFDKERIYRKDDQG